MNIQVCHPLEITSADSTQFDACNPGGLTVPQAYIGPPAVSARYEILRSAVVELGRAGIVDAAEASALPAYWEAADSASGWVGALRSIVECM